MKVTLPIDAAVFTEATVEIEWSDATTAALVTALGQSERYRLEAALAERDAVDHHETVLTAVREFLAGERDNENIPATEPVGVVFTTDSWDNGRFYAEDQAEVYFADGSRARVDFDDDGSLRDVFADMGKKHDNASLSVDLRTGKIEEHDIVVDWVHFGLPREQVAK